MKFVAGAVLFFVLVGSNLQAFDKSGKDTAKAVEDRPKAGSSAASAMLPPNWKSKRSFWLYPTRNWQKSICAY